jgi:hypothetical protein
MPGRSGTFSLHDTGQITRGTIIFQERVACLDFSRAGVGFNLQLSAPGDFERVAGLLAALILERGRRSAET